MWPYGGRRAMPHSTQNLAVHNLEGYPQNPIYTTYMPYAPNLPYLPQEPIGYMTYAPYPQYSQQKIGYTNYAPYPLYSQQKIGACLSQDPMASDMILQDQNWLFQNYYKRETMPEYRNGEVVMVRCNQHKWLPGVIQRMSAQGMCIWITDVNILVNVPLVLVPTHVVKMSMYLEPGTLPQVEPVWTTTNNGSYQKLLMQCVCPTHLSHHQLFRVLENNICAICKNLVSNMIDVVSPWNCHHQVHNYCLQFQMQKSSMATCPSCNESASREHMLLASSNNAFTSPSNGQQRWFNLQCVCGFRTTIASISSMEVPVFCSNCQQRLNINLMQSGTNINVNSMTIEMQSGESRGSMILNPRTNKMQSASANALCAYSELERELSQSLDSLEAFERERFSSAEDFGLGWPMQSFNCLNRLEAIEEDQEGSEPSLSLEPPATNKFSSYLPSRLEALCKTFENNNIYYPNVVARRHVDQDIQPHSSSQSSWHDGLFYEPFHNQSTLIQNNQYSNSHSSLQNDLLYEPSRTTGLILNKQYLNSQSSLHDSSLEAALPSSPTLMKIGQSVSRSLLQHGSISAPPIVPISLIQNEQSRDNAHGPFATSMLASCMSLGKVEEANEAIEKVVEMDKTTITSTEGYNLWKRVSEPNTTIIAAQGQKLLKIANEANKAIAPIDEQKIASELNTTIVAIEGPKIWKKTTEPNTAIAIPKVQKLLKRASEPNTTLAIAEGQEILKHANESNTIISVVEAQKRASEPNTTIVIHEVQKVLNKANEPNKTVLVPKVEKLLKGVSEPITTNATIEDKKLWKMTESNAPIAHKLLQMESEPNANIATIEDQQLWKSASETNKTTKDHKVLKRANEPNTTLTVIEGQKALKRASELDTIHATTNDKSYWKRASKAIAAHEGQQFWRRASEVNWTDNEESGDTKQANSSNDFATSSSGAAPMYINHFNKGQKSWRRSNADWTSEQGDGEESEETIDTVTPSTTPTYINHFVDFVKLAMVGSSTAKDIIASASPIPSTPNPPPLECETSAWVSTPLVFFTRASALFTETAPAWVTLNKDPDQADWITVIKDGVDSRKDDKRWELERLARAKDSEFL